jgi:HEXXH motif-containing protein
MQDADSSRIAAEEVIRHPAVAAWAVQAIRSLTGKTGSSCAPERLAAVAAAVAIRRRIPFTGITVADAGRVVIPSLGTAIFPGLPAGSAAEISVRPSGTTVHAGGTSVRLPERIFTNSGNWAAVRRIDLLSEDLRLQLVIDDLDPYRFGSFSGLAAPLTDSEAAEWTARFGEAWRLLVRHHRQFATELATMISAVTPLQADAAAEVNATSRDVFGSIALSRPRSGRSLALALVHETQHAKLAALLDLADLVRPGTTTLCYAPWRADPRPPKALLHGAYAFLGVAGFWRRQREHERGSTRTRADSEYARWRDGTAQAVETLSCGPDMTALGYRFLAGMRATLTGWRHHAVPAEASTLARVAAENHRDRWLRENGIQTLDGSKSASSR